MSVYPVSIIISAIDKASKEIGDIMGNVAALEAEVKKTAKAIQPLGLALTAAGTAGAVLSTSSALLSARAQELGVVLGVLGKNVGYTDIQLDGIRGRVEDLGITSIASSQSLVRMIQANIDLASATDLARLAQDAAVIGQMDSSAAFERLIMVIQRGSPLMARRLGLNVSFNDAYKEQAALLGIATGELTEKQKVMARVNAVMEAGTRITGAYEAAMTTSAKMLRSMSRLWVEARIALGDGLLPVMEEAVSTSTYLLESFNNLDPAAKSVTGSVLGCVSALALLTGGFVLLTPKILATVVALKAVPTLLSSVAVAMSKTAAASAAASGGVVALGTSLAVLALPITAVVASLAAIAAALKFARDKAEGYETMNKQLVTALEDEAKAGASAADMVQVYADRRTHANKALEDAHWLARLAIDDQKVMTLSYEELLAIVGPNIASAEEFAQVQQAIRIATAESTEELSTLAKTIDLAGEAIGIFKQTYAGASEEMGFFDSTADAIAKSLNYMTGALGDVDKAHKDLTHRNQELGTSFESLQAAIEAEKIALEEETTTAEAAVASSERMMKNLEKAMNWDDILQRQEDYHTNREKAYTEADDALSALEVEYAERREEVIQTSQEMIIDLKWDHADKMAGITASYLSDRESAERDAHQTSLEEEEEYQKSRENILRSAEEEIADIEGRHEALRYETDEEWADRLVLLRADHAEKGARAREDIDEAENALQKHAAEIRFNNLMEEQFRELQEMENNRAVLEGLTAEERDAMIAQIEEERDTKLTALKEQYEAEAQIREREYAARLARLEEDAEAARLVETARAEASMLALVGELEGRTRTQAEYTNALLEKEKEDYETQKQSLDTALTNRLGTLERNWLDERQGWQEQWGNLEIDRLAAMLKNEELTEEERQFLEESIEDIAAQFGLVTPEAMTFAKTEARISDATSDATSAMEKQDPRLRELFLNMMSNAGAADSFAQGLERVNRAAQSYRNPGLGSATFPHYQSGAKDVPHTGLAMLHAGEAVLPEHEAKSYRQGGGASASHGTQVVIYGLTLNNVQDARGLLGELQDLAMGEGDYNFRG